MTQWVTNGTHNLDFYGWRRQTYAPDCIHPEQILAILAPEGHTTPRDTVRGWTGVHPLTDPFWHTLPAGFSWVPGRFFPMVRSDTCGPAIVGDPTDCPHCALVAADAWIQAQAPGSWYACCLSQFVRNEYGEWEEPGSYWRQLPLNELTGSLKLNTDTTKCELPAHRTCSNCGRYGHRRDTCERPAKAHDKVGIEIEGRWTDFAAVRRRATDLNMPAGYEDGSVRHSTTAVAWEFQTVPGTLYSALEQLTAVYPDECDSSCGMHVHVSFLEPTHFTQLNTAEFFRYFKHRWESWGVRIGLHQDSEFYRRLRGDNDYCNPNEKEWERWDAGERYSQLNFLALSEHGTVECRLLPMFQHAHVAVSAVQELVDIYEAWLSGDANTLIHSEQVVDQSDVYRHHDSLLVDDPVPVVYDLHLDLAIVEPAPVEAGFVRLRRSSLERQLDYNTVQQLLAG